MSTSSNSGVNDYFGEENSYTGVSSLELVASDSNSGVNSYFNEVYRNDEEALTVGHFEDEGNILEQADRLFESVKSSKVWRTS